MGRTVLLAEDDALTRMGMCAFLNKMYENVIDAENGLDAWEKFQENEPDIVITDLSMPKLDGTGLIGKIRDSGSGVKIIVLSATLEDLDEVHGADACVVKPVDFKSLKSTIDDLLS